MIEIKVNRDQLGKFTSKLGGMVVRLKDGNPFFRRAAIEMYRGVIQNFNHESGPEGKWKALKKKRERGGGKILQDRGFLRGSILFHAEKNNAIVSTNLIYAATHQYGRRFIPARPFMWISDKLRDSLTDRYGKFVAQGGS